MPGHAHPEKAGGATDAPDSNNLRPFAFTLALLGPFSLADAHGQEIAIASKKNRLLLAMLALELVSSAARN